MPHKGPQQANLSQFTIVNGKLVPKTGSIYKGGRSRRVKKTRHSRRRTHRRRH